MRRIALAAVAAAALITAIVAGWPTLAESARTLRHLDWVWVPPALGLEAVSLVAFGLSRRRLLRANGDAAGLRPVMAITYASNALSMSVPFAGAQLAAVFSYRQFRRHGLDSAITSWALAVSAILSSTALALVLVVGAVAGGAPAATAAGFAGAAVFLLPAVTVLLALRYRPVRAGLNRLLRRILPALERLSRRTWFDPDALEDFLDRVASISLPWPRYAEVFALAVVNWLADCGALACSILATGQPVPAHGLLLAYGAGAAVGSSGLTPGGFALVEVALTASLAAAGLSTPGALAAALAYRAISFWLILLGGGIAMLALARRPATPAGAAGPTAPGARTADTPAAPR